MSDVFDLYRKDNGNGSSKDWGIAISSGTQLIVRHCATNKPARLHVIPLNGNTAESEKNKRIRGKFLNGYVYVGQAKIVKNRFEMFSTPPKSDDLSLFYRGKTMIDDTFLMNIFKDAADKLDVFDFDEFSRTIKVVTPTEGLFWEYPISSLSEQAAGRVFTGEVDVLSCGIWPLLLLMFINEQHELDYADAKGKEAILQITPTSEWFANSTYSYIEIEEKASQLGLILTMNDYQNIANHSSNAQVTTFWF